MTSTHAFIDAQNVYRSIKEQGWQYDLFKLRQYLSDKYGVTHAWFFIGFIPQQHKFYALLRKAGYLVVFKEIAIQAGQRPKGNVDVDLTLHAAMTLSDYDVALLVSADGDFLPLVKIWKEKGKFGGVLSPAHPNQTSLFLRRTAVQKINFMPNMRKKIEQK